MAIFRCRYTGAFGGGDTWSTSLNAVSDTATVGQVLTAWQTLINTFVGTTLKPLWSPYVTGTGLIVDLLDEATGKASAQAVGSSPQTGTGAAATQINQRNALVAGLRTAKPTKAGRGRMYWPPLTNATLDANGLVLLATRTSIANALWAAIKTFNGTATACVYHRPLYNRGVKPPILVTPGSHDNITAVTVGQVLGTQTRRSNKVANSFFTASG